MATYIDIHILQTVPPSNINRDDTGSPKSALFGGVRRARVSSQAWKRATREEFRTHLDHSELGERTVHAVERVARTITALRPELADTANELASKALTAGGLNLVTPKKKKGDDTIPLEETQYLLFLSRAQIEALAKLAIDSADREGAINKKQAKAALTDNRSIDVALFGRMVADSPDLNVDACCQVSHALSVHPAPTEFDYFTAKDDNSREDNAGAEMIGTVEFVSSTFYRYATINADELVTSLGSKEDATRAVEAFVKAFIVSMPSGKQNTFANRTRPDLVLMQIRSDQPVNFVDAFEDAITATTGRIGSATIALAQYMHDNDSAYGTKPEVSVFLASGGAAHPEPLSALEQVGSRTDLAGIVQKAGEAVPSAAIAS